MAIITAREKKESKTISANSGFTLYLLSLGFYHLFNIFSFFYYDLIDPNLSKLAARMVYFIGMAIFIIFTDVDNASYTKRAQKKKYLYLPSLISILFVTVLLPLTVLFQIKFTYIFVGIIILFVIVGISFMSRFKTLELVKRSSLFKWFYAGLGLSGFANFLNIDIIRNLLGANLTIITSLSILIGCIIVTRAWYRLPSLSELDWMIKMERLLIIHLKSSILLYQYEFKKSSQLDVRQTITGNLVGGAIGGFDMMLCEILGSKEHIKEIDHSEKKIIFSYGAATACILITDGTSKEFKYRLEMFHLTFEKRFNKETLKNWDGSVNQLKLTKIDDLIQQFFT
ncbi:MAG: hypothetical protein ACFE8M_07930 [Candidatus Hermodarchaeota archaeon]